MWEESAPSGYLTEPVPVKVIVSREGVFADGGMSGDAVQILLSPGELVKNMTQFADPALMADPPLQNVEAAVYGDRRRREAFPGKKPRKRRGPARYGPQGLPEGEVPVFTVDEGWERLGVLAESGSGSLAPSAGTNLTALFAGKTDRLSVQPEGDSLSDSLQRGGGRLRRQDQTVFLSYKPCVSGGRRGGTTVFPHFRIRRNRLPGLHRGERRRSCWLMGNR